MKRKDLTLNPYHSNPENSPKTILVTGGCGFIGSNFIRYELENYDNIIIINLDKLTYAGNLQNLKDVEKEFGQSSGDENPRYFFIKGDICDRNLVNSIFSGKYFKKKGVVKGITDSGHWTLDYVINFAAETHVDRSILSSEPFIETNIKGTQTLLEAARTHWQKPKPKTQDLRPNLFIHISTDEVYGSLGKKGKFTEVSSLSPNSPYSASKAAADLLCRSYYKAYSLPVTITRSSNNYGPYQFPEKLIPLIIKNAIEGKKLPVYGDGTNVRDWLYVEDNCRAIDLVLRKAEPGEIYNIGGENEIENIKTVKLICETLKNSTAGGSDPENLIQFIKDPRGEAHDFRYALDCSKIKKKLGWKPTLEFRKGLKKTVDWYLKNQDWIKKVISGDYLKYYNRIYK